jgi:hypothetical protein
VYRVHLAPSLKGSNWYGTDQDWVMRHVAGLADEQAWSKLSDVGKEVLGIAASRGLGNPNELIHLLEPLVRSLGRDLLLVCLRHGIAASKEDLKRLAEDKYHVKRYNISNTGYEDLEESIALLRGHGVGSEKLCNLLELHYWDTTRLAPTLAYLQRTGITEIGTVLERLGAALWQADTESWRFAVEVLRARTVEDFCMIERLLAGNRRPSPQAIDSLYGSGFQLSDIAECQDSLATAYRCETLPAKLALLRSSPLNYEALHLKQCSNYLSTGSAEDLSSYLNVLAQYGFASPDAVLAFQVAYPLSQHSLAQLLGWSQPFHQKNGAAEVGEWIHETSTRRPSYREESLAYLSKSVSGLSNLEAMSSAVRVAAVDLAFLRFLVERRRLDSVKKLEDWYDGPGKGAHELRWGGEDAMLIPLFDDAYRRKSCATLVGNTFSVLEAIDSLADDEVGPFRRIDDPVERDRYLAEREATRRQLKVTLPPHIATVLADCGGIVLASLLYAAYKGTAAYDEAKLRLPRLMEDLLMGAGPVGDSLEPLQRDAIAHVYGVPMSSHGSDWHRIPHLQGQLSRYKLKPTYGLTWLSQEVRIVKPLDSVALKALSEISAIAGQYCIQLRNKDLRFEGLRRKRLGAGEADIQTLRHHIALLVSLGVGSELLTWTTGRLENLATLTHESPHAAKEIEAVHQFLTLTLPDALQEQRAARYQIEGEDDALSIAYAMAPMPAESTVDGFAVLEQALAQCIAAVRKVGDRWYSREKGKFDSVSGSKKLMEMSASVSKHRAAYYARISCELCTSHNMAMWEEDRYSHLVVFDPVSKRLTGMAMLYIQRIPEVDRSRDSLIVRGMNLRKDMDQRFNEHSVVDAILGVCKEIAVDNSLACVAIPEDNGQHLLSNSDAIAKAINSRLLGNRNLARRSALHRSWQPADPVAVFHAYETGNKQGAVTSLVLVWAASCGTAEAASEGRDVEQSAAG